MKEGKYDIIIDARSTINTMLFPLMSLRMNCNPRIFINIEAKSLRELGAVFANSHFFFGNEGGPRHISQAFDIPSYAIFPPYISVEKWLPANAMGCHQGIGPEYIDPIMATDENFSYTEKFQLITPARVWEGLNSMLDKYMPKKSDVEGDE